MQTLTARELKLGDTVKLFDGPFGTGIVQNIDHVLIHFFRPYATCSDVFTSSGVIPYIGIEHFARYRDSKEKYEVYSRKEIKY